ncbi:hypothetical protein ACOKW7_11565 [Limnospira platensis CENA597]
MPTVVASKVRSLPVRLEKAISAAIISNGLHPPSVLAFLNVWR